MSRNKLELCLFFIALSLSFLCVSNGQHGTIIKTEPQNKCTKQINSTYLHCPHKTAWSANVGDTTNCTCVSNCRNSTLRCNATGEWLFMNEFNNADVCNVTTFSYKEENLMIYYKPINGRSNETRYSFKCDGEYQRHGAANSTCSEGQLQPAKLTCKEKNKCRSFPDPPAWNCSNTPGLAVTSGSTINCRCNNNCRNVTLTCGEDGSSWYLRNKKKHDNSTTCKSKKFNYTEGIVKVFYVSTQTEKRYNFQCGDGYEIAGDASLECTDGALQGAKPKCVPANSPEGSPLNTMYIILPVTALLGLLVVLMGVYIWRQRRKSAVAKSPGASLVRNQAFQPPNQEEENEYEYPGLDFQEFQAAGFEQDYDYPIFQARQPEQQQQQQHENSEYAANDLYGRQDRVRGSLEG